jgi:hypothetical protein
MEATYTGQDDEREVVSLGRTWLVKNGETVDLPDDVAAGLDGQDGWTVTAPKTPGRKATTTKDGDK